MEVSMDGQLAPELQALIERNEKYRRFVGVAMVVGLIGCTALVVIYGLDLGEDSRRAEVEILMLSGIAWLMLAWGIWKNKRTPGIATALHNPVSLNYYKLIRIDDGRIGVIWIFTTKGRSYEIPIDPAVGERTFEELMKLAPQLTEKGV
jgi:hypothetical protein